MEKIDYYREASAERKPKVVREKNPPIKFGELVKDGSAPICPINGKQMSPWLTVPIDWRRPTVPQSYQLFWEAKSQYGMLYPRPTVAQTAEFYQLDEYYTHHLSSSNEKLAGNHKQLFEMILQRVAWQYDHGVHIENDWPVRYYRRPGRLLDIGSGSGKILLHFSAKGWETVGIDPDFAARQAAAKRGLQTLDGTAENIPAILKGQKFDAVIMTHVLEHCIDPVQALRNAADLLKRGGRLIVEVPNCGATAFKKAGITWRWLDVPRHLNFFTLQSLRAICELVGLETENIEFQGYYRQFTRNWLTDEQLIWDRYHQYGHIPSSQLPTRQNHLQFSRLLLQTIFAPAEQKYDSVRLIARAI